MKIQNSFTNENNALYLVPTPIGNFADMTYRAVELLDKVDLIYCEDTRVTKVLLSHFNIKTPLSSYHIFNEELKTTEILTLLGQGKNIALVTDAGMPGISDPGYLISTKAIANGYKVISLPGANAALTALIASGLPCEHFYFYGFLPSKDNKRKKELESLKDKKETIIIYESPHRIRYTLQDILNILGNRDIAIAREITKKFEEYLRGKVQDILDYDFSPKGEFVVIIKGEEEKTKEFVTIKEHYNFYLSQGLDEKEAMKKVANARNIAKSEVYKAIKL